MFDDWGRRLRRWERAGNESVAKQALMCLSMAALELNCNVAWSHLAAKRNDAADKASCLNLPRRASTFQGAFVQEAQTPMGAEELWVWWSKTYEVRIQVVQQGFPSPYLAWCCVVWALAHLVHDPA